jgi:hypothetical protein
MANPVLGTKIALRPRYTLLAPKAGFAFTNHDAPPFTLIKPMQWNAKQGFVELLNRPQAFQIYTLLDWKHKRTGAIYQAPKTRLKSDYFLWMYDATLGSDGQPHIRLCYWISLNEGL